MVKIPSATPAKSKLGFINDYKEVRCNWCVKKFKYRSQKSRHQRTCKRKPNKRLMSESLIRVGQQGDVNDAIQHMGNLITDIETKLAQVQRLH